MAPQIFFINLSLYKSWFGLTIVSKTRLTGSLLKSLDHHTYIVWSVRLWLDTLFTASYDCTVAHIKFQMTETNLEIVELNQIQGPEQWADAMGADDTGTDIDTKITILFWGPSINHVDSFFF